MTQAPSQPDFYGTILKSLRLAEVSLSETAYAPGMRVPPHSHAQAYLCYVRKGTFSEFHEGRSRTCQPSSLIFHPAEETHSDKFHDVGGLCFNIEFGSDLLSRLEEYAPVPPMRLDFQGGLLASLAARLYYEFRQADKVSALVAECLVLEILAETSRRAPRLAERQPPRWLVTAREIIQAHFSETLSLADVALAVGAHPVQLARAYRRHYRCTVGEDIRQRRIEFACRELSKSDVAPLAQIASAAGFTDQSHFSKTFKRVMGLTPVEFRRTFRHR